VLSNEALWTRPISRIAVGRRQADRVSNPDAAASATLEAEIGEARRTADRWR
jgi:hypothetical protein